MVGIARAARWMTMLAFLIPGWVWGGVASVEMTVSATVIGRTLVTVESQPADLSITPVDIARGFVDLPDATRLSVRSNEPGGWDLRVSVEGDLWSRVEVVQGRMVTDLGADGGTVLQPNPGRGSREVVLGYRIHLAAHAGPGTVAWPLAIAAGSH